MKQYKAPFILGISFILGSMIFSIILSNAIIKFKTLDRSIIVKGLSERECLADTAIWSIIYTYPSNDLSQIYTYTEQALIDITNFLIKNGITTNEVTSAPVDVIDKSAVTYQDRTADIRYTSTQAINVYSTNIQLIRELASRIRDLGKRKGIVFSTQNSYDYNSSDGITYLFTKLNDIKPSMIQEATEEARKVALKFANDSRSKLGKIKNASQGQFSIINRDATTAHIKKIRVVTTIEYYLSD